MASIKLGALIAGRHELRIQPLETNRPMNLDYIYLAERDFEFLPPCPNPRPEGSLFDSLVRYEVLGFKDRTDTRLEVDPHELVAGRSTITLRVRNLDTREIDLLYTFNGKYMPIIRGWKLDESGSVSVDLSDNTPRGIYVYRAIRDARDSSPTGWIPVDVTVRVK